MSIPECTSIRMFKDLLKEILHDSWYRNDLHFSEKLAQKAQKALDLLDEMVYTNGTDMYAEFLSLLEQPLDILIEDMKNRLIERGNNG